MKKVVEATEGQLYRAWFIYQKVSGLSPLVHSTAHRLPTTQAAVTEPLKTTSPTGAMTLFDWSVLSIFDECSHMLSKLSLLNYSSHHLCEAPDTPYLATTPTSPDER